MTDAFETELNIKNCLTKCLEVSHNHVKTAMGSKEVVKSLIREKPVQLVVLAKDLLQKYQDVILERCKSLNIPLIYVETREELGEMCPVKSSNKAGAVAILDFVIESREKVFLMNEIK